MTSLLYSGQLLAKDPLSDWFSVEQYTVPKLLSSRPGFVNHQGDLNIRETRRFLSVVLPELNRLRPLIEKGIVILVPSRPYLAANDRHLDAWAKRIVDAVGDDLRTFTQRFRPPDLATEDNVRGAIPFIGGNRENQIRTAIERSAKFFMGEYALAQEHGFTYAASFEYETYLCQEGLGASFSQLPGARVLQAVFRSRLPLLSGLTPEVVARIRDDESFGAFRAALYETYKDVPDNCHQEELDRYIAEVESAKLSPVLAEVAKEVSGGALGRIGLDIRQAGVRLAAGILLGTALAPEASVEARAGSAAMGAAVALAAGILKKKEVGAKVIWKKLFEHQRLFSEEMPRSTPIANPREETPDLWGIPENPGLQVHISSGAVLMDFMKPTPAGENGTVRAGGPGDPYALCPCESGEKWKFCCKGLERVRFAPRQTFGQR
jgi:hypothetical protein